MKKLPTFTLVRKLKSEPDASGVPAKTSTKKKIKADPLKEGSLSFSSTETPQVPRRPRRTLDKLARQSLAPNEYAVFASLEENFKSTLLSSAGSDLAVSDHVFAIIRDLARHDRVLRVGILDLASWIGELPALLEKLNAAQPLFTLFEIQAPLPSGLIKSSLGVGEWAAIHAGPLSEKEREHLQPQMIADEFFIAAEDVRQAMGLDLIVGMTSALIAGLLPEGGLYWNHFGSVSEKTILVSTADMRVFSEQAGKPFEVAIGALLVSTLLIAINRHLGYHDDTGCLFDYNADRSSYVNTLKALHIEKACLDRMNGAERKAALAMLSVLKRMKRRSK